MIQSLLQDVSGSVWCFASDTRAIFKKKTTNVCELSVQGSLQCFVLRDKVDELDDRQSGFWRLLVRWLWIVKIPLKMLATNAKKQNIYWLIKLFFFDGQKFWRQCVNVIDSMRLYLFFNVWKCRTRCAMAFSPCVRRSTMSSMKMDKKSWWHCTLHQLLSHLILKKILMVCAHQKWIELFTWVDYKVNAKMRIDVNDIHLNRIFCASCKISTPAENSHDALSHKSISEELIDMSGCISIKTFLKCLYSPEWCKKHLVSNLERVMWSKFSLCFWCAYTISVQFHVIEAYIYILLLFFAKNTY